MKNRLFAGDIVTDEDGTRYMVISIFRGNVAPGQSRQPNVTLTRMPDGTQPTEFGRVFTHDPTDDDPFHSGLL